MKKLIIICLLALTYTSTYAQEPTKQETMDWIASKFEKYLLRETSLKEWDDYYVYYKNSFNKYSDGVLYLNRARMNTKRDNINYEIVKINLNEITDVEIKKSDIGEILILSGGPIHYVNETWYRELSLHSKDDYVAFHNNYINFDSEPNLFERMKKAFQTLAKINNTNKPVEKF